MLHRSFPDYPVPGSTSNDNQATAAFAERFLPLADALASSSAPSASGHWDKASRQKGRPSHRAIPPLDPESAPERKGRCGLRDPGGSGASAGALR